ncbi:TonB-dependent receptor plug domain-containing protein [Aquirhabdus parva]|uniref:TonB-dependent receptor n=1 Tax=Aquirhabdus parva TaxID=2283318 RepID=A0A345P2E8_9GAMM|nr:TonB-dependent receptor [Aquirhabdus parva]AXI01457.1 TonB-dependent receptor [Aquirhabdus parva]
MRLKILSTMIGLPTVIATLLATETVWGDEQNPQLDTVVVTGTRSAGRTALASSVPVDVITSQRLQATGFSDLARALEFTAPSLNFPRAHTTPSAANTRAITLKGLSPDEVLVLINGKRWHPSVVINTNFAVGRGSAPYDLSTIPLAAVDHVEILRDGAAAQYGSDAIAGVVNIILRKDSSGGSLQTSTGITDRGDGGYGDLAVNKGFALAGGYVNVTGEVLKQQSTNRAAIDQRYGRVTYQIGDPDALNLNLAANAAFPILNDSELYATGLVSRKDSTNVAGFRAPGASPLFPNGFGPQVNPILLDSGLTVGLRGILTEKIKYDLSNTFGSSNADFTIDHTANSTLGSKSPTSFDAGSVNYLQNTLNASISRPLPEILEGGNLSLGAEYRYEKYEIKSGEFASYTGTGSAGFPGFNPRIPVDNNRDAAGAFIDLDLKPFSWLTLGAAGRYDHYSDFGNATTGKFTARAKANSWLSLRGSVGTGFRAPSLQQQFYSSTTSLANGPNKAIVNVGTYQVGDPIAQALGATALRAEKSKSANIGIVLTPLHRLSITADYFRTDIDHRIALSDALAGPAVLSALKNAGASDVQQVAFFTNAVDTRTQGYEVAVKYLGNFSETVNYGLSMNYAHMPTRIQSIAANPKLPTLPLLSQHSLLLLTEAQPRDKLTSQFRVSDGTYEAVLDVTRYGEYTDAPIADAQKFGAEVVLDLALSARLSQTVKLTGGILNLANSYPDKLAQQDTAFKTFGGSFAYGEESPFGISGRTFFLSLNVDLP